MVLSSWRSAIARVQYCSGFYSWDLLLLYRRKLIKSAVRVWMQLKLVAYWVWCVTRPVSIGQSQSSQPPATATSCLSPNSKSVRVTDYFHYLEASIIVDTCTW